METDRMLADVADAAARRDDVAVRSPVGVDHLRRARRGRSESRSRRRKRRTTKIRRNPVNPRRVAVTAEVVAALRRLAEAARETETARVLAAVVAAVPTNREAAFDPGVRVVTAAARAQCVAGAPAGDAARRLTVEAANDAAGVGAPNAGEVAVAVVALRG